MSSACAPTPSIAATARTTTPFCAPTRPAWTAATTPARASPNKTGTQSAVTTAKAKRGLVVTNASVLFTGTSRCSSTTTTRSLCTWFIQTTPSSPSPTAAVSLLRLAATAVGSSPTWSPRLKVSNGGADTPPARVVVTRRIRTLTRPVSGSGSVAHERRHVDIVVVVATDADRRAVGVHRHAGRIGGIEQRRGYLARLARCDRLGAGTDNGLSARTAGLEARGDNRDADLVAQRVVDDRTEDDVGFCVRGLLHQRGGLVDLEQAEVAAAGDRHQHALGALHRRLEQR